MLIERKSVDKPVYVGSNISATISYHPDYVNTVVRLSECINKSLLSSNHVWLRGAKSSLWGNDEWHLGQTYRYICVISVFATCNSPAKFLKNGRALTMIDHRIGGIKRNIPGFVWEIPHAIYGDLAYYQVGPICMGRDVFQLIGRNDKTPSDLKQEAVENNQEKREENWVVFELLPPTLVCIYIPVLIGSFGLGWLLLPSLGRPKHKDSID
ncbi:MAG: hypothetical protein WA733_21760 [Methylocystis sp.]